MNTKFFWISILGVLISFAGGFLLANALNSGEIKRLTAQNAGLQKAQETEQNPQSKQTLSNEEIQSQLQKAEANPDDFVFQKNLGLALYSYAGSAQDKELLKQITVLLERAHNLNPNDYSVIVSLGNLYYDIGQIFDDPESNLKARNYYKKALEKNEKDSNVLTDYGLTFLLTDSPQRDVAIKEFTKALAINSRNEKALVYLTQAYIEEKNFDEANKFLDKLKEVNPKSERISALENSISREK